MFDGYLDLDDSTQPQQRSEVSLKQGNNVNRPFVDPLFRGSGLNTSFLFETNIEFVLIPRRAPKST